MRHVLLKYDGFYFAGVEARGFIFGPPIALAIGAKFVPLRKPKKLPGTYFIPLYIFSSETKESASMKYPPWSILSVASQE